MLRVRAEDVRCQSSQGISMGHSERPNHVFALRYCKVVLFQAEHFLQYVLSCPQSSRDGLSFIVQSVVLIRDFS